MIKLIKKRTKGNSEVRDKIAKSVASCLVKVQQVWAGWMNRQSDKCNPKLRGAIIIIFLMAMAAIATTMVLGGFKGNYKMITRSGAIRMPALNRPQQKQAPSKSPDAALLRIEKFRLYLDSLSNTEDGKIELDRINRIRPGLQDSIKMVELLYKQQ